MIGEPQRAFSGAQFQLVFPVLSHYGVELWVPEVGGAVDPDSDAHDLVMSLFGGLSKAERRRVQHRTRASILALATTGRWLGGRPNYGYRLVDNGLPHPNRSKASAGVQLRTLEPDPETAPVVRRIFELYDAGVGFRSIAQMLEAEGIPSPGEIGPARHPRSAGVWGGSAVRAILTNPRYLGRQVAGRQRRYDELLSARDPALGTISRQRRQSPDSWTWSEEPSWPALIPQSCSSASTSASQHRRDSDTTATLAPRSVRPGRRHALWALWQGDVREHRQEQALLPLRGDPVRLRHPFGPRSPADLHGARRTSPRRTRRLARSPHRRRAH